MGLPSLLIPGSWVVTRHAGQLDTVDNITISYAHRFARIRGYKIWGGNS